jgi:anti-anti-sigma regulatory factor
MFRITKIFDDSLLAIHKIEGKVTDEGLEIWMEALNCLKARAHRKVILDFCQVWSISSQAIDILTTHLSNDIHVMNPCMDIRNRLHSAGFSACVLE